MDWKTESEPPRDANVAAMMRCEAARLNFEEEMRSVLLVAGLLFLCLLVVDAMMDEPVASFLNLIAGRI